MKALILAALVGVFHVHHEPSHDSDASFEQVRQAAAATGIDFVVLTEHVDPNGTGALPGFDHAGIHVQPDGRELLVLAGAEFGTLDGHLLGLQISRRIRRAETRPGREVIGEIHAQGGFAVVPHPESHGGWHDWKAPFDGLEVQNSASDFSRHVGPLLPLRIVRHLIFRRASLRRLWVRPETELARWEELLVAGRRVAAFAGADAHQNVSVLGLQLDPYAQAFGGAQMVCPGDSLDESAVWAQLRGGHCTIRYAFYEDRRVEAAEVAFPSGRTELQLDGGARVLEIRNPAR